MADFVLLVFLLFLFLLYDGDETYKLSCGSGCDFNFLICRIFKGGPWYCSQLAYIPDSQIG